jgi:hypothetical protein
VRAPAWLGPPGRLFSLLALYACWGSTIPAMKLMVRGVPPLAGAGAIFTLGWVVLMCAVKRALFDRSITALCTISPTKKWDP